MAANGDRGAQRFITGSPWDDVAVRRRLPCGPAERPELARLRLSLLVCRR